VWALLADVTRMGEWSPECRRSEWLDGATAPAPGVRFRGHSRISPYRWSRTCTIVTAEPDRELAFATLTRRGEHQTLWHYRLDLENDGVTLDESFEIVGPVGFLVAATLATRTGRRFRLRQIRKGMSRTLEGVKAAAEAG
jgi:hypothetical protein